MNRLSYKQIQRDRYRRELPKNRSLEMNAFRRFLSSELPSSHVNPFGLLLVVCVSWCSFPGCAPVWWGGLVSRLGVQRGLSGDGRLLCLCGGRWCPTLPHPGGCSTIGAGRLSFRVRDGSGRVSVAVATAHTVAGCCVWCSGVVEWTRDYCFPLFVCVGGGVGGLAH